MKLSLIVTVYNCDNYLSRCFDSLKKQSYGEYEIVIVDDGSQDMSPHLCDMFAKERENVKVIHKSNGGTVSARKAGIEAATGQVVGFIDGDDWIDKEFCSRLIHPFLENDKVDVVSSGLQVEYEAGTKKNYVLYDGAESRFYDKVEIENDILPNLIYDSVKDTASITTSICCKMIKKNIALDSMKDMDDSLTLGEDGAYVLAVLLKAKGMYVMKEALYHYEQHSGSQNYQYGIFSFEKLKKLQECMMNMASKANKKKLLKAQIDCYIKSYLEYVQKNVFDIGKVGRVYVFPMDEVKTGSNIVIHGAGQVGQQYVKFIKKANKYNLVGWTDKNSAQTFVAPDIPCSIHEITKLEYDYIILASNDKYILKQMKEDICYYNIPENKVLVKKPVSYLI